MTVASERLQIRVYGVVQGVGFRPFVVRIAGKARITGSVCNKGPFVEIFAEGPGERIADFLYRLEHEAPERSFILNMEKKACDPAGDTEFRIIRSEKVSGAVFVSPDIAICPECRKELFDPANRRYLHPFINCTACGPRLTILDSMPYDRIRTSMGQFQMCRDCEYEYTHEQTRRFHAQPVCCNDCGPRLYIPGGQEQGAAALVYVRNVIRNGGIAAVKGIGGFHLCCDAANGTAVERLRKLKKRPFKPFAVMMRDMETVRRECRVLAGQETVLDGPQKPILLLGRKQTESVRLCSAVAPDNPYVGVMLPYAPVQLLLFAYPDGKSMTDCFVMTSGNPPGAPICKDDEDAVPELSPLCDVILSNDRMIRLRADDSVMSWLDGSPYMIRRSRGYAPLPVMLPGSGTACVLGIGGELKNTFCLAKGGRYYLSPYVGDLADVRSITALRAAVTRMENLLELKAEAVACDMHPEYNSALLAEESGLPVVRIQHHYAHIASCLAENGFCTDAVGVSFDGTGYGTDRTIWGGEFMRASFGGFTRLGSIEPFIQAGGDVSAREGWRIAVSLLCGTVPGLYGTEERVLQSAAEERTADILIQNLALCDEKTLSVQRTMLRKNINCVVSTSMGRIFDAVSAILGIRRQSTFEGEAAMALEYAAEEEAGKSAGKVTGKASELADIPLFAPGRTSDGRFLLNTTQLIHRVAELRLNGVPVQSLAYAFHVAAADMTAAGCRKCRSETGLDTVALSGGVMQNLLFVHLCRERLEACGFRVLVHRMVPANDGGIALGQAAAAMAVISGGVICA